MSLIPGNITTALERLEQAEKAAILSTGSDHACACAELRRATVDLCKGSIDYLDMLRAKLWAFVSYHPLPPHIIQAMTAWMGDALAQHTLENSMDADGQLQQANRKLRNSTGCLIKTLIDYLEGVP